MIGRLNTEWHDVPAGTELRVIRQYTAINKAQTYVVERLDGRQLPGLFGYDRYGDIDIEFIDLDEVPHDGEQA